MKIPLKNLSTYDKRFILAIIVVLFVFAYVLVITLVESSKPDNTVTGILLTTGFTTVISFYYGSSDKKGKDSTDIQPKKDEEV